jgi:hypothetical protein
VSQVIFFCVCIFSATNLFAKEEVFRNLFFECEMDATSLENKETARIKLEIFGCGKPGPMGVVMWDINEFRPMKLLATGKCTHLGKNVMDEILIEFPLTQSHQVASFKLSPDGKGKHHREALIDGMVNNNKKMRLEMRCKSR